MTPLLDEAQVEVALVECLRGWVTSTPSGQTSRATDRAADITPDPGVPENLNLKGSGLSRRERMVRKSLCDNSLRAIRSKQNVSN